LLPVQETPRASQVFSELGRSMFHDFCGHIVAGCERFVDA